MKIYVSISFIHKLVSKATLLVKNDAFGKITQYSIDTLLLILIEGNIEQFWFEDIFLNNTS